jgi:hypothetical protein
MAGAGRRGAKGTGREEQGMKRSNRRAEDVSLVRRCRICNLEQVLVVNEERGRGAVGIWITRDEERVEAVILRWTLKHLDRAKGPLGLTPEQVADYREDPYSGHPFRSSWGRTFECQMARVLGIEPDYHPARAGGSVGWHDRHDWRKTFDPWPLLRTDEDRAAEDRIDHDWNRVWTPEDDLRDADDHRDGAR